MKTYKLDRHTDGMIIKDGTLFIPSDPANIDYQAYLKWVSQGNTPEPADADTIPPIAVSPRQIRQALTQSNKRAQVEAAVTSSDQDTKDWWNCATSFEENHPKVLEMCTALGISDEQRHGIFVLAKSL